MKNLPASFEVLKLPGKSRPEASSEADRKFEPAIVGNEHEHVVHTVDQDSTALALLKVSLEEFAVLR